MSRPSFTPFEIVTLAQNLNLESPGDVQRSSLFGRPLSGSGSNTPTAPGSPNPNRATIECLDLCDVNLYIGTSDGHVLHCILERSTLNDADRTTIKGSIHVKKFLGLGRRPIDAILAVPTESKLAVLCDATASFFELDTLNQAPPVIAQPVKAITCFCAERDIQSPLAMSFAKRRILLSGHLGDMLEMEKEWPLPDGAIMMVRYGSRICAADQNQYKLINVDNGVTVPLFPYDRTLQKPVAVAVTDGEYLLVTSSSQGRGLGVFISPNGEPVRGTLEWPAIPNSLAFHFPYVIALLSNNIVEIHNLHTQKRAQSITLPAGLESKFLIEATFNMELGPEGASLNGTIRVLVGCKDTVLALRMAPLASQISELLELRNVEAAVELAHQMAQEHEYTDGERNRSMLQSVYQRAGLLYFKDTLFEEAFGHFRKGDIDPEILISLFPDIAGPNLRREQVVNDASAAWASKLGTINDIVSESLLKDYPDADPQTLRSFSEALVGNATQMLGNYLRDIRNAGNLKDHQKESVDTALLRIYADTDRNRMYELLGSKNDCRLEDCESFLQERQRHYAVSLLYKYHNLSDKTLDIWTRIASNEIEDPDFPGVNLIADYLTALSNKDLVMKYSKWLIKVDPMLGVKAITTRTDELFSPDEAIRLISAFGDDAVIAYLEHLISAGNEEGDRHTELAELYIDRVNARAESGQLPDLEQQYRDIYPRPSFSAFVASRKDDLSVAHHRLLSFLTTSLHYSVPTITQKVQDNPRFCAEQAVVLGRTNQHDIVLRLLVAHLHDHVSAEQYCLTKAAEEETRNKDSHQSAQRADGPHKTSRPSLREHLLFTLFRMYLEAGERGETAHRAVLLLNRYSADFEIRQVLRLIPEHWSLEMLSRFLASSMRTSLHTYRECQIVRALARGDHFKVHAKLIEASQLLPPVYIPDGGLRCLVCGKGVTDPTVFARLPGGEVVHLLCKQKWNERG